MVYNQQKVQATILDMSAYLIQIIMGLSIGITAVTNTSNIETLYNYFDDMPLGYYKVEETTAPTGYTVDNA